jgi:hypothetical protein
MASVYEGFRRGMADVMSDYKFAPQLVRSMRKIRSENPQLFEYVQTHFLDSFKYRIANADNKSGMRRAVERRFRKVDEIPALYQRMFS